MGEIKTKDMDKLKLTPEQKVIFHKALLAAYEGGSQDATFLANSMYQLVETSSKILPRVMGQFCEDDDMPEEGENDPVNEHQ